MKSPDGLLARENCLSWLSARGFIRFNGDRHALFRRNATAREFGRHLAGMYFR